MAPTSKPEKRRSIPKFDTENQLDNDIRHFRGAARDGIENEGQLKRALVGLPGQGEELDADTDGAPKSLPFISLPYAPPPSNPAEGRPITTLVPIQESDVVAAPAAAPPPKPTFKTIPKAVSEPTSTSSSKRPVYTLGSILPKGTATGIAGNFQSASVRPQRTTLSAALPKATGIDPDDDSDDSDDEEGDDIESDDEDKDDTRKPPAGKPSKSSTATRPVITSSVLADHREGIGAATPTSIPKASGIAAAADHTSRGTTGGEKAAIAIATIGFVVVLLAMVWFFLRRVSKRNPGSKPVWPANFPSGNNIANGTRRVSSKFSDKFLSLRDRIVPGANGWSSLDDGTVYDNDKSPLLEASDAKAKRGKRTTRTPSRVMVNPYGMVFRKPRHDSTWSDIMLPAGEKAPPLPQSPAASLAHSSVMSEKIPPLPPMPASVMSPTAPVSPSVVSDRQAAAAAHLENARKSVAASVHNKSLQTPLRRNTNMSDLSSLSSGFGDGDIIIMPPTAAVAMKSAHPSVVDSHVNLLAVRGSERVSFASQSAGSRDTVYTSVSDDGRPHFRPVSAWVRHQQSRRAKVAVPSAENGIPAMPDPVPQQGFDLMMPDEQEPRRVESSMWKDKKGDKETA
ncbi:hypothetical protein BBK36DRAFT_1142177 [Trichoderma citrinoviride]|uniref:Uncharacterized protein n=1 Tax=Trichoderma citrinoviride TaxID=58853 RepID=A0A2T4B774_9HYPO|nr:hypothetical protein BBK36DRAFT_1142177 [Trichoderma citrinoviride]PTB65175.1 hypothetical protein BBK36DRAFT_1142177 [Trichoderma citrinoviride]